MKYVLGRCVKMISSEINLNVTIRFLNLCPSSQNRLSGFRHISFDGQVSLQESSATRRHSIVMSGVILSRHKLCRSNSTFVGELTFLELQFCTFEFALQGCNRWRRKCPW